MALLAIEKAPLSAIFFMPILGGGQPEPWARVFGSRILLNISSRRLNALLALLIGVAALVESAI
jgi:hypothetical protein